MKDPRGNSRSARSRSQSRSAWLHAAAASRRARYLAHARRRGPVAEPRLRLYSRYFSPLHRTFTDERGRSGLAALRFAGTVRRLYARRQLQDRRVLAGAQAGQENDLATRKFQGVVMLIGTVDADSGPSWTVIPAHCGQHSGDCGQFLSPAVRISPKATGLNFPTMWRAPSAPIRSRMPPCSGQSRPSPAGGRERRGQP